MADLIDRDDSEFARVILASGPCPDAHFLRMAMDMPQLRDRRMSLVVGGNMVRAGFFIGEKWRTRSYHEFLQIASARLIKERERKIDDGNPDHVYFPFRHQLKDYGFVDEADRLVGRDAWHPYAVAWTLIEEGMLLCETIGPEYYTALLGGMTKFIGPEIARTKAWPRD